MCSGLRALRFQAQLRQFFNLIFHLPPTSHISPPSCDWVLNSNGPGGTSGAHSTCCEERPVLLRVPTGSRSFACTAHSACLVHRRPGSARCVTAAPRAGNNLSRFASHFAKQNYGAAIQFLICLAKKLRDKCQLPVYKPVGQCIILAEILLQFLIIAAIAGTSFLRLENCKDLISLLVR